MIISYDVSDWKEEFDKSDNRPTSGDDAIDLMRESSVKTGELARDLIINRELGNVDDESLPSNKMANLMGMSVHLSGKISRQAVKARLQNKKEVRLPRFVATTEQGRKERPDEVTLVEYRDPKAVERAVEYLMNSLMGRVRERLEIVAASEPGKVKQVVSDLKKAIDKLAKELT